MINHDLLTQAWRERDLDALCALFAPDVELYSPLLHTTFKGHQAARDLYSVLFNSFGTLGIWADFQAPKERVFLWRAELGRSTIEGADFVRYRDDGLIDQVRVFIRPLSGLADFAIGVGPVLASRRGRWQRRATRLLSTPLRPLFAVLDRVAPISYLWAASGDDAPCLLSRPGALMTDSPLTLRSLAVLAFELRPPIVLNETPAGQRWIVEVGSGSLSGERLRATVRAEHANADWFTIGPDKTGSVDARILAETDDGAVLFLHYQGRVDLSVPDAPIYITPRFEVSDERYRWLNKVQAVGKGYLNGASLAYQLYELV